MLLARGARAQTPAPQAGATDAIAADIARHVSVMARDSMQERDTPSLALERTARYVAEQFNAVGLVSMGDSGGWAQRYPVPGHSLVDLTRSSLGFWSSVLHGGRPVVSESGELIRNFATFRLGTAAVLATDTVLELQAPGAVGGGQVSEIGGLNGPAPVVIVGAHTVESVRRAGVHDKVVVYVPDTDSDSALEQQIITLLRASNHVIVAVATDSAGWAARRRAGEAHRAVALDWYLAEARSVHRWVIYVWSPAIDGVLASAGFDPAEARASHTPIVREIAAAVFLGITPATADLTAPNILGLLPGSEPGQALVLTAHMDQAGSGRKRAQAQAQAQADSVTRGTDDNAVGVAGLLALAKAFKAAGVQPRRLIVFAAVSGGAREFWGSSCLIENWGRLSAGSKIAMNVNLDAIGHGIRDSIRIDGLRDVELPASPAWLAASWPELRLTVADGGTAAAPESDHFAFVRQRIPSLYLHTGPHRVGVGGGEQMSTPFDPDQAARLVRFVLVLAQSFANASQTPSWTAEGRERRRRVFGD